MTTRFSNFSVFIRIVGFAWIIGGITIILFAGSRVISGWNSNNWSQVQGKIIASNLFFVRDASGKPAFYKVKIVYTYSLSSNGFTHALQNSKISFRGFIDPAEDSYYNLGEAQRLIRQYPAGRQVQVYYNSTRPEISVLRPGEDFWTLSGCIIGLITLMLGTLLTGLTSVLQSKLVDITGSFMQMASRIRQKRRL